MVKINIDFDLCKSYGQCAAEVPDVFWIDEQGYTQFKGEVDESRRADVERAADVCPMQAITVE